MNNVYARDIEFLDDMFKYSQHCGLSFEKAIQRIYRIDLSKKPYSVTDLGAGRHRLQTNTEEEATL